jgi:hypothetical protein
MSRVLIVQSVDNWEKRFHSPFCSVCAFCNQMVGGLTNFFSKQLGFTTEWFPFNANLNKCHQLSSQRVLKTEESLCDSDWPVTSLG